jgi:hypothetical protein
MYVPFDELSDGSRIWIYQSGEPLDDDQVAGIGLSLKKFLQEWRAHGQDLTCSYVILHKQFIVIGVEEQDHRASGCSIDHSVHFIRSLEQKFNIRLVESNMVPFIIHDRVTHIDLREIRELVRKKVIRGDTTTFNNAITRKDELSTNWKKAAADTWISRYFT